MKKWLLITIAILSSSVMHADSSVMYTDGPEKAETLSSKVILQNTNGYFVLSDRSCWKVIGFSKRWRSLTEWWNNVQLAPENYACVPNDWYLGSQIEVYPKYGNLEISEGNASNQEALKQCTHLLVNTRTGQVLFAIALEPAECTIQLFNDAHEDGYDKGFHQGRLKTYQNANEIYNSGRAHGYKAGYTEGYQAAMKGEQPES
jgi:hypothetical protein